MAAVFPARLTALPALLACAWLACALSCGPDPEARLKSLRLGAAPGKTLEQVLSGYPYFSRVTWTSYPGRDGAPLARATGLYDLDRLLGKTMEGRAFTRQERQVLDKAGASLAFVLEYALATGAEPLRTKMEMRIVAMGWDRGAELADEAVLREIVRGEAGPATVKAALDAAAYCRTLPPGPPARHE